MGIARKKKKKTLKAKMLGILTMCAMTSLLAAVIVSYMELRMIQNDSIEDNMKMYLDQITKNTDEAYYDMISIVNYMGPGGLIGNVTDSYLDAVDNFDRFVEQRSLRQELLGLGYVNTKLVGATYYDKEEKKELISGMNVRTLDGRQNALPKVVKCAGNVMQADHTIKIEDRHGKDQKRYNYDECHLHSPLVTLLVIYIVRQCHCINVSHLTPVCHDLIALSRLDFILPL